MEKGESRWSNQKETHSSDQYESLSEQDIAQMKADGMSADEIQAAIDYQNGHISGSGWSSQRPVTAEGGPWDGGGQTEDHFSDNRKATTTKRK